MRSIRCAGAQVRILDVVESSDEIARLAFEDDLPARHHQNAVGDLQRLVDVLLDEQDRHALVGGRADRAQQAIDDHRRETERELVDEEYAAAARETTSQREHLLLATREEADAAFEMRLELGEQRERTIEVAPAD